MFPLHGSEEVLLLQEGGERLATVPVLVLNAYSRCNCRCVMCDIWKRDTAVELSAADLERHSGSLRRLAVEWVVISGGEPLMHGNLRGLCMFLRSLDVRLTLLTTGLLLVKRATDVAELFDDIIVSLDGPRSVHEGIRRVKGSFDLIAAGVAEVHRLRSDMRIT